MAQTRTETGTKTRRRNGSATRGRRHASARTSRVGKHMVADDIAAMRAEVDDMMAMLETKIADLNRMTKQSATHAAEGAGDAMRNAITGLTGRIAGRMESDAKSASDEVARFGNSALRRIASEIDHRPLLTLAIAAGIGFIAGLARPRE